MKNRSIKSSLLIIIICATNLAYAQVKFEKVFGGSTGSDFGNSVVQTFDKGYAIVGTTTSFGAGSTDAYLLQIDSMGVAYGQKTFGGINIDQAYSVKLTSDSGLVIAGYTNSFGHGGYDMYVIKTKNNGDTLWTNTYGGTDWDFAYSIEQTSDGGFIIAGGTYSYGKGNEDMFLVKTNSLGDTLWTKTYGGANDDEAKSVKQTSDGGYIITGNTKSFGDLNGDMLTVKTNNLGDTLWTHTYHGSFEDNANDVLVDNSGLGYIIAGETKSSALGYQGAILRLNLSGIQTSFINIYGGSTTNDGINSITQTNDGRFATIGYTFSYGAGASDFAFYLEKPIGSYVGSYTYGGSNIDKGYCIKSTSDGGYIICGTTLSYSTLEHIYLIKTDSVGHSSGSVVNVVTGINSIFKPRDQYFLMSPNPANDFISINLNNNEILKSRSATINIVDLTGRICFQREINTNLTSEPIKINTSELSDGTYIISISSENYFANQKLIIQKN
jgi:hypothetical protein